MRANAFITMGPLMPSVMPMPLSVSATGICVYFVNSRTFSFMGSQTCWQCLVPDEINMEKLWVHESNTLKGDLVGTHLQRFDASKRLRSFSNTSQN